MKKRIPLPLILLLLLSSCDNPVEVAVPVTDPEQIMSLTTPLPAPSKSVMEGIYTVVSGKPVFGDEVVVKWKGNKLAVFTSKEAGYAVLDAGSLDSTVYITGYWRQRVGTGTGPVSIAIAKDEGAAGIIKADTSAVGIVIRGTYGVGTTSQRRELVLQYLRPFSGFVKNSRFLVIAHRGGGRNSDYLGCSENTIEMISRAEGYGADGIEIDVKVSKDGVPFLYHDDDINLRLTQKGVIWGKIEQFSWPLLSTLITLKNGERIPSLQDALQYIIDNTTLRFVWLDLKSESDEMPLVAAIQKEMLKNAKAAKRDLEIVIGLPTEDKVANLMKMPAHDNIPTLCELSPELVRGANSLVWAPRWTLGTQNSIVAQLQAEGRRAFVWTLDDQTFIKSFIDEGIFDGILTNYPSVVAYYHYMR
ncbi:MAG: glycerophosphodiester phosphodiesterase [Chlorobiota bacterium]|nr:MAG: glycerophosphodiester phosphodiesterase [Chlorobiota bacterium]